MGELKQFLYIWLNLFRGFNIILFYFVIWLQCLEFWLFRVDVVGQYSYDYRIYLQVLFLVSFVLLLNAQFSTSFYNL